MHVDFDQHLDDFNFDFGRRVDLFTLALGQLGDFNLTTTTTQLLR